MRRVVLLAATAIAFCVLTLDIPAGPQLDPLPAPPRIDQADAHRFTRGGEPWYPVGFTPNLGALTRRCDNSNLNEYYLGLHAWLESREINYYRAVFTFGQPFFGQQGDACKGKLLAAGTEETLPYMRTTGQGLANDGRGKFDLDEWNQPHFEYWRAVIRDAAARGIVIEISIFDSFHNNKITHTKQETLGWGQKYDFYLGANNINGVDFTLSNRSESTWHILDTNSPMFQAQKKLVEKVNSELGGFDNVILEVCNEPNEYHTPGEPSWTDLLGRFIRPDRLVVQRELLDHKQTILGAHDSASIHAALVTGFALHGKPLMAHNDCVNSCLTNNPSEVRQRLWAALTAGGHYNHLYNSDKARDFNDVDINDGALYLGFVQEFIRDRAVNLRNMAPFRNMDPEDTWVSSPDENGAWAYARVGQDQALDEYVVYKRPEGDDPNSTVTVKDLTAQHLGTWFNPRTGEVGPDG